MLYTWDQAILASHWGLDARPFHHHLDLLARQFLLIKVLLENYKRLIVSFKKSLSFKIEICGIV